MPTSDRSTRAVMEAARRHGIELPTDAAADIATSVLMAELTDAAIQLRDGICASFGITPDTFNPDGIDSDGDHAPLAAWNVAACGDRVCVFVGDPTIHPSLNGEPAEPVTVDEARRRSQVWAAAADWITDHPGLHDLN